jgi:hypothetical protein
MENTSRASAMRARPARTTGSGDPHVHQTEPARDGGTRVRAPHAAHLQRASPPVQSWQAPQ